MKSFPPTVEITFAFTIDTALFTLLATQFILIQTTLAQLKSWQRTFFSGAILNPCTASNKDSSNAISEEKTVHNVAMRMNNVEDEFSGDFGQCWEPFKDEYDQVAENYDLSDVQKMRFLHNLLAKNVHRFFLGKL